LRRDFSRFTEAGAILTAIGQGSREETATFVEELDIPFPVLADPQRRAYDTYGAIRGSSSSFLSPTTVRSAVSAVLHGMRPGRVVGDARQLGGTFIIDPEGIIRYAKPSQRAGDHPTTDEVIARVRELSLSRR